jgi:hypothetical protein
MLRQDRGWFGADLGELILRIPAIGWSHPLAEPRGSLRFPSPAKFGVREAQVVVRELGPATRADVVVLWRKRHLVETADRALMIHVFASSLK